MKRFPTLHNLRREFGPIPLWFWNDELSEQELLRQIADFEAHGVHGFVIHPRVGLPNTIEWMSEEWLDFVEIAVREAHRRKMKVVLYDEAMYPSGSSGGQVVDLHPKFQARCLSKIELPEDGGFHIPEEWNIVSTFVRRDGAEITVVDRPADARIRGIHYLDEGPEETAPILADILNPDAVAAFIELVYDRYARRFSRYFGDTIIGFFTDEPSPLGKCREKDVAPGTSGILEQVTRLLGYDFAPHLPALWFDDEPDAPAKRKDYHRAIRLRLDETYYAPLGKWCSEHGVALMGHPAGAGDLRHERHFHIPGQDAVWRWVLPGKTAVEGSESTSAKCASSAAIHHGRRRNSMECFGAYGHELSWEEMMWLANWCFVRGTNMIIPHAFYYSIRGPRRDERPPDVGPNSPWWDRYQEFANHCALMSYINTDSRHVCKIAILSEGFDLPYECARACYEHQIDFNYLDVEELYQNAKVSEDAVCIGEAAYEALISEDAESFEKAAVVLAPFLSSGRVFLYLPAQAETADSRIPIARTPNELISLLRAITKPEISIEPSHPSLRGRHIAKGDTHYLLLFNEGSPAIKFRVIFPSKVRAAWIDETGKPREARYTQSIEVRLQKYQLRILALQ